MDFVWVFPLLLVFLSIGQIHTKDTEQSSEKCWPIKCQAGYHKIGVCSDGTYKCKKCESNTFTELNNTSDKCFRCELCKAHEVETQSCSFNRNVKCDCKDGYYYQGSGDSKYCIGCPEPLRIVHKQAVLRSCNNNTNCEKKCKATTKTTTTTTTTTSTTILTNHQTSSSTSPNPAVNQVSTENHMLRLFYVVALLVVVMLFWLVLLFIWMHSGKPNTYPWWGTNKGVEPHAEDCKFSEHRSHQDSSPTTLTINIPEETPMMPLNNSPITPQHPAHVATLLPNSAQKVAKQDEQSEQWPAIVLYAIIKEVPLRRWKEFLRLLSVADQQLERVELEAGLGLGSIERQYHMLRLWSQRSSASLNDVFSALHYMDLSGCAQLLQESLEKLQWSPDQKQGFTACRDFSAAMQDT